MADDLTTTEFAIAMLAARDWTTQEIAKHLKISVNTVKSHISEAMRKLNVENRKDLKKYMLFIGKVTPKRIGSPILGVKMGNSLPFFFSV